MNLVITLSVALYMMISDTLSSAYGDSWQGVQGPEQSNIIMQAMASNNLIFVVLAVTLIIWFVLIFYLVRLEKKIDQLEQEQKHHE